MKFTINKQIKSNLISTKIFDLGNITTNINNLLNNSIINIDKNTLPILKISGINYLINNYNFNNYTEDYEINITENDLIKVISSNTENFKTYRAILNQIGPTPPTANVLKNTFISPITFTRFINGYYFINSLSAEFIVNKTFLKVSNSQYDTGLLSLNSLFSVDNTRLALKTNGVSGNTIEASILPNIIHIEIITFE